MAPADNAFPRALCDKNENAKLYEVLHVYAIRVIYEETLDLKIFLYVMCSRFIMCFQTLRLPPMLYAPSRTEIVAASNGTAGPEFVSLVADVAAFGFPWFCS